MRLDPNWTYYNKETFPARFDGSKDSNQTVDHHERTGRHKDIDDVFGLLQLRCSSLVLIHKEVHQQPHRKAKNGSTNQLQE